MRRFDELQLVRSRTSLFALSWSIMHRIDESSPLYGVTPQIMEEFDMERHAVEVGAGRYMDPQLTLGFRPVSAEALIRTAR